MVDVTLIGAGIANIFLAYTLIQEKDHPKIRIIDKGCVLEDRICPMASGVSHDCVACAVCHRFYGFGGLGKSEGKFNYTTDFGGQLGKKIGNDKTLQLMERVDEILCTFGGSDGKRYSTDDKDMKERAEVHSIQLLTTEVRHLGTRRSLEILDEMYACLKGQVEFVFNTDILSVEKKQDIFYLKTEDTTFKSKAVVLGTGLSGGQWLLDICEAFGLKPTKSRVDLGLRVEMKGDQLDALLKNAFETKLKFISEDYEATTYCMNPKGRVIKKYQGGLVMADGQNYLEEQEPSENLNFTLFLPRYFSDPAACRAYAEDIIKEINRGQSRIAVQRLADLKQHRFTTAFDLEHNAIKPTLEAEGSNLYEEVPERYIRALLETFMALEGFIGEEVHGDTLLYALDGKFYEPEMPTDTSFETEIKGLYLIGDCSGETWSLSQAAASGIYLGLLDRW